MKYYQDITLIPDAEANLGFLWQKVFQQIHLAIVENKVAKNTSEIAISIPNYGNKEFPLGNKLRLFAKTNEALIRLDVNKWLNRLTDYCHYTSIKEVPQFINTFARFKRVQFNTNIERLARRRAKRKGESFEQAMKHFDAFKEQESKLPFINMSSLSKDEQFRLFVEKELAGQAKDGEFSSYGLSKTATVPWF